ncbi:hypothetical protein Q604_UNBC02388G0001, partial [human gut metagenome]
SGHGGESTAGRTRLALQDLGRRLPQLHRLRLSQQEVKHRAGRRARVRAGGSVAHDELTRTQPRQTHHTHS